MCHPGSKSRGTRGSSSEPASPRLSLQGPAARGADAQLRSIRRVTAWEPPGENGRLARTDDEWLEARCRRVQDAALRARLDAGAKKLDLPARLARARSLAVST